MQEKLNKLDMNILSPFCNGRFTGTLPAPYVAAVVSMKRDNDEGFTFLFVLFQVSLRVYSHFRISAVLFDCCDRLPGTLFIFDILERRKHVLV